MSIILLLLAQGAQGDEVWESKSVPTLLSSLGAYAGYMRAPRLVGNGAVGGAYMATHEWWQSTGFYLAVEGYYGSGKMGADLEMGGWQRVYLSPGRTLSGHLALGFTMHATPEFFESEEWKMEAIRAGLTASVLLNREITEDFSLLFWLKYGIVTSEGTPNYLSATVGAFVHNPF